MLKLAQTCTEAGKNPGGCAWTPTTSCFVADGRCYCDIHCRDFNDCCEDVPNAMSQWGKSVCTIRHLCIIFR